MQPPTATMPTQPSATQTAVSELSRRDMQLVDIACFQHRRKPGSAASTPAPAARPIDPRNTEETALWRSLVGKFTTPTGGVRYKDMAIAWNACYQQLAATGSAGRICTKHKEHLKSYHLSLTAAQAVQQGMQIDSSAAATPSWSSDLAALATLKGSSKQVPGSTGQMPLVPGLAVAPMLAVPGLSGYRQPALQLPAPAGGGSSSSMPDQQLPVGAGWLPVPQQQQQLPPELTGLLSTAPAPAVRSKNQGGKDSGSYCQAANEQGIWPNVPVSHPLTDSVCPKADEWAAKQQEPKFRSWLNKKQKQWQKWKKQQQQRQQQS